MKGSAGLILVFALMATGCGDCDPEPSSDEPAPVAPPETSWSSLDPPAAPGALGASLTAARGAVFGTWIEPLEDESHQVRFARLEGDRWSEATTVAHSADMIANWADFPRSALGGDGSVYVHWAKRSGEAAYAYEVQLTRSRDGGHSFEALGVVHRDGTPTEHGFVSMLPTDDGLRLFWLDGRRTGEEGGATAVYTTTVGAEVADASPVDDRACDCCQTDAAMGPGGPMVVFRDREDGEIRDVSIARPAEGGAFLVSPVHRDGWEMAGCPVNGPAIAAEGQRVVVAWFTGAEGGAVLAAFSDDGGRTFGAPIEVDAAQPPGRVDAALLADGAAVSWLARAGSAAEVRVRFVGEDGTLGAPSVVARTASERASGFPVMVREADRLLVAHRDDAEPPRVHVSELPVRDLPRIAGATTETEAPPAVEVGDELPDALLVDADDATLPLTELHGDRPLVLAFFARWCQPCRRELAELETLRADAGDSVDVIAVSIDEGSAARATEVARRWGFEGRVLRDRGAAAVLGAPPIPALLSFDADGVLRGAWRGERAPIEEVARLAGRAADGEPATR